MFLAISKNNSLKCGDLKKGSLDHVGWDPLFFFFLKYQNGEFSPPKNITAREVPLFTSFQCVK
jgi:hypothetical protein